MYLPKTIRAWFHVRYYAIVAKSQYQSSKLEYKEELWNDASILS